MQDKVTPDCVVNAYGTKRESDYLLNAKRGSGNSQKKYLKTYKRIETTLMILLGVTRDAVKALSCIRHQMRQIDIGTSIHRRSL